MPIGQYHYDGLIEAMHEIRDEMRALRKELKVFLELPQRITVKGDELPFSSKEELEAQFREWENKSL
jgi:hypothetical protein